MQRLITKRIGDILLERGVITPLQLQQALERQKAQGGLLGQCLVDLGHVTEEEVALALTAQYGFPYLPLQHYEIDDQVTQFLPESVARQHCVVPVDQIGHALTVAMADPSNQQVLEELKRVTRRTIQPFISTPSEIRRVIDRAYHRAASHETKHASPPPASQPPPGHDAEH